MDELRAAIDRLAQEIDALDEDDVAGRERLRHIVAGLTARLDRHAAERAASGARQADTATGEAMPDPPPGEPGDNALLDMVALYEARHPRLTAILNDIMTRLASMGI